MKKLLASVALSLAVVTASVAPSLSAAFFGWQVSNVPYGDVLNVRAGPTTAAPILIGYPNGTPLSLTGACTRELDLNTIAGWSHVQQKRAVRYRWCQIWLDPYGNGQFQEGWVYGRYISPL